MSRHVWHSFLVYKLFELLSVTHRMWTKDQTKLAIAARLVIKLTGLYSTPSCMKVVPKGVVCDIDEIPNITITYNVRVYTAIYALVEKISYEPPKRGRREDQYRH